MLIAPHSCGRFKINRAGSLLAQSCKYRVLVQNTHFLSVQKILGASPTNHSTHSNYTQTVAAQFHVHSFTQKRESLYPVAVLQYTSPQDSGKGYGSMQLPVNFQPTTISVFQLHFYASGDTTTIFLWRVRKKPLSASR